MVERKTSRSPITKKQFHEINRDIKDARATGAKMSDVASKHGVSYETARTIRDAGTWPKFEALKQARREERAKLHTDDLDMLKRAVSKTVRQLNPVERSVDDKLNYVSPSRKRDVSLTGYEFHELMTLGDRVVTLEKQVKTLMEWHDSYRKTAEEVAERILGNQVHDPIIMEVPEGLADQWAAKGSEGTSTVNGLYPAFDYNPDVQPKKRLGIFRGRHRK